MRAPGGSASGSNRGGPAVLTMEELFVIHQLREQGESITEIARRTGLDRKTVRKYLSQGLERPRYGPRAPRPRVIDPYRKYLRDRSDVPSYGSSALNTRTRVPAPPPNGPSGPARPSGAGTPARTVDESLPLRTPPLHSLKVSTKAGRLQSIASRRAVRKRLFSQKLFYVAEYCP